MNFLTVGIAYVLISVAFGALGAHAFADVLATLQSAAIFATARDYLAYHGLALMAAGFADSRIKDLKLERALFLLALGAAFFSVALFVYSLSGWKAITYLAPLGGGLMMVGWLKMFIRVWRHRSA